MFNRERLVRAGDVTRAAGASWPQLAEKKFINVGNA
jgi:hypothetical protein